MCDTVNCNSLLQVPHVVRLKTLVCKAVGVLFSVAGGEKKYLQKHLIFVKTCSLQNPLIAKDKYCITKESPHS